MSEIDTWTERGTEPITSKIGSIRRTMRDAMSYTNSAELVVAYEEFHRHHRERIEGGYFVEGYIILGRHTYYFRVRRADAFLAERYKAYFEVWDGKPDYDIPTRPVSCGVMVYSGEADALKELHAIEG